MFAAPGPATTTRCVKLRPMPAHDRPPETPPGVRTDVGIEELRRTPAWLPFEPLPGNVLRLIQLTEPHYRSASFLDSRVLQLHPPEARCASATLAAAADGLVPEAHFVFHIGHVGSTLLARLMGEHPSVFALREPALLRAAAAPAGALGDGLTLTQQVALLSRTWRAEQRALIKTTSFVSEISSALLECSPNARALLLFTRAPVYLRAILAGANSRAETRAMAPSRLARLTHRLGRALTPPHREGEWIAMSWLCEMTALGETAQRCPAQVQWMDFEAFLLEPAPALTQALTWFGVPASREWIDTVLAGPLMHRYSKAPEHAYDPQLRQAVLAQAEREHGAEVRAGLAWLAGLPQTHPPVASALSR